MGDVTGSTRAPDPGDDVRVVVNPERTEAADALSIDATEIRPDDADGLADAADEAVADGADVVAAIGGDGTQRTVAEAVSHTDAAMAVVPGGTVNLLGRVLGIETIEDAETVIESGTTRPFDVGRCDGRSFLLNASTGYDADVIAHVGDRAKRFGRAGYTAVGLWRLAGAAGAPCRVRLDGEAWFDDDALSVLVLNVANRGSTRIRLVPDAEPDDGFLDVLVIRGRRRSMFRYGWSLLRGTDPSSDVAVVGRGRQIEVEWEDEVASQRDGDADGTGRRFVYDVDPGALAVRVPDR